MLVATIDESVLSIIIASPSINQLRLNEFVFNPLCWHVVLDFKFVKQISYENVVDNCVRFLSSGQLQFE